MSTGAHAPDACADPESVVPGARAVVERAAPRPGAVPTSIAALDVHNPFRGRIREVIEGPVVSEVDVEIPGGQIATSVITTRSVKLGLAPGREVVALVKSTEVSLATL